MIVFLRLAFSFYFYCNQTNGRSLVYFVQVSLVQSGKKGLLCSEELFDGQTAVWWCNRLK